jgi:hypothetical protein
MWFDWCWEFLGKQAAWNTFLPSDIARAQREMKWWQESLVTSCRGGGQKHLPVEVEQLSLVKQEMRKPLSLQLMMVGEKRSYPLGVLHTRLSISFPPILLALTVSRLLSALAWLFLGDLGRITLRGSRASVTNLGIVVLELTEDFYVRESRVINAQTSALFFYWNELIQLFTSEVISSFSLVHTVKFYWA